MGVMLDEERVNNSVDLLYRVLVAFSSWSNFSVGCCNSISLRKNFDHNCHTNMGAGWHGYAVIRTTCSFHGMYSYPFLLQLAVIPTILFMWTCVLWYVCVYLSMSVYNVFPMCLEVSTKLYHNTVKGNLPPNLLTCQIKMATRPLLSSRQPIPSAIAKYTPYEAYTT